MAGYSIKFSFKPSPAVLLQGRHLRSGLHCPFESLAPKVVSPQQVKRCLLSKQSQCTFYHDANKCFRDPLKENQTVRVRKEKRWVPATVVRHTNNPQSYLVRLTNGYVVRRNRTQINTTREEGLLQLQTSSRVGPNAEPNRAIVSNRVAEPNRAIVSNRIAEPNRAIVSTRVAEPNRAIVSNRVYEPTRANQPNEASKNNASGCPMQANQPARAAGPSTSTERVGKSVTTRSSTSPRDI